MPPTDYQQNIIQYYRDTENAYKDSWDLNNSLAIHYGYWDEKVKSFSGSLLRMNEVMMEAASITSNDEVLDAGCGVGGSSIFLALMQKCKVTGITLSERQVEQARENAISKKVGDEVHFERMDYSSTRFAPNQFDVVWGCESICYADPKSAFIREAFRILKPGGRLVVADGFVTHAHNNHLPVIRKWLDGWQVNYLETPEGFQQHMELEGFTNINYRNISKEVRHSSARLNRFYYLAKAYLLWKKISFSKPPTSYQRKNIDACRAQYLGMKKQLWEYGLVVGKKPL